MNCVPLGSFCQDWLRASVRFHRIFPQNNALFFRIYPENGSFKIVFFTKKLHPDFEKKAL